jgi:hypothetical protein
LRGFRNVIDNVNRLICYFYTSEVSTFTLSIIKGNPLRLLSALYAFRNIGWVLFQTPHWQRREGLQRALKAVAYLNHYGLPIVYVGDVVSNNL